MPYELEHLHPGWFGRCKYRTLAGIYDGLPKARDAVDTNGVAWKPYTLVIGKYRYPIGWECYPFGRKSAFWRITAQSGITVDKACSPPKRGK